MKMMSKKLLKNALTPGCRVHLSKVYGLLMAGGGLASVGVIASSFMPFLSIPAFIGSFVAIIALAFSKPDPASLTWRQNLMLGASFLCGAGIAPLVLASSPGVVFSALLGTSAIFGSFSLAALKAKRKSMMMLGGVLGAGFLIILSAALGSMFLPMLGVTNPAFLAALYNVNLYGGLGIFSLFIAYDTQRIIEDYHQGNDDHVMPAMSMFMNLLNIFTRLLAIFGGSKD